MKKCKITVLENTFHPALAEQYAREGFGPCGYNTPGQIFYSNGWRKPEGLCDNAWKSMMEYVMTLSHGGGNFYNGWMKREDVAVVSCNDGIRPVLYLIERTDEDTVSFPENQ